jgi:ureidoacrylate peracid hydrolase
MQAATQLFILAAQPEPIKIGRERCAVLVIDMQNDFGARGGMFDRAGIDITPIERVVEPTVRVLATARAAGLPIVYLKMEHIADLSSTGVVKHRPLGVGEEITAPDGRPSRILVEGTWNTEILPQLIPRENDIVVSKRRFSGFFQTNLDHVLKERGITHLIVTGCTTSVCVEATVRDAMYRDYRCVVLADCTAEPIGTNLPRTNHEASLLLMKTMFGWVSDSERFIEALAEERHWNGGGGPAD